MEWGPTTMGPSCSKRSCCASKLCIKARWEAAPLSESPKPPGPDFPKARARRCLLLPRQCCGGARGAILPRSARRSTREPPIAPRGGFFMTPNNSVYGGIRINLAGREQSGRVRSGPEFDDFCQFIRRELLGLINVDTGEPAVRSVERTEAYYDRAPDDELPDLFVDWNRNGPIETVWSPRIGFVHAPYLHWRTGDHRLNGFLFASGPGIRPRTDLGQIANGDLCPTICAMLGHRLDGVDGRPVPALLRTR